MAPTQQRLLNMNEITGGSPYGTGILAGGDGARQPTANELATARTQGRDCLQTQGRVKRRHAAPRLHGLEGGWRNAVRFIFSV